MTYPDDFKEFWRLWPGRWYEKSDKSIKVGKHEAYEEWVKISEVDRKFIVDKLLKTGRLKNAGTQYLPDAFRWLKRKRWRDFE